MKPLPPGNVAHPVVVVVNVDTEERLPGVVCGTSTSGMLAEVAYDGGGRPGPTYFHWDLAQYDGYGCGRYRLEEIR